MKHRRGLMKFAALYRFKVFEPTDRDDGLAKLASLFGQKVSINRLTSRANLTSLSLVKTSNAIAVPSEIGRRRNRRREQESMDKSARPRVHVELSQSSWVTRR